MNVTRSRVKDCLLVGLLLASLLAVVGGFAIPPVAIAAGDQPTIECYGYVCEYNAPCAFIGGYPYRACNNLCDPPRGCSGGWYCTTPC
jgi:hypothetical protein